MWVWERMESLRQEDRVRNDTVLKGLVEERQLPNKRKEELKKMGWT